MYLEFSTSPLFSLSLSIYIHSIRKTKILDSGNWNLNYCYIFLFYTAALDEIHKKIIESWSCPIKFNFNFFCTFNICVQAIRELPDEFDLGNLRTEIKFLENGPSSPCILEKKLALITVTNKKHIFMEKMYCNQLLKIEVNSKILSYKRSCKR